jgi:diguanylate cyclase (GGDEF)-like protein
VDGLPGHPMGTFGYNVGTMSVLAGLRDPETGTYVREFFNEVILRELERARRHKTPLSVLSVLVVNWESVVRAAGREGAANALASAANHLTASVRETDFIFRWEVDEFLILLVEADIDACTLKIQQLGAAFRPWREGQGPIPHPVKIRFGASALEEGVVFAAALQGARAAARDRSGEQLVRSVTFPA